MGYSVVPPSVKGGVLRQMTDRMGPAIPGKDVPSRMPGKCFAYDRFRLATAVLAAPGDLHFADCPLYIA